MEKTAAQQRLDDLHDDMYNHAHGVKPRMQAMEGRMTTAEKFIEGSVAIKRQINMAIFVAILSAVSAIGITLYRERGIDAATARAVVILETAATQAALKVENAANSAEQKVLTEADRQESITTETAP